MKKWYNTYWGIALIIASILLIAYCLIPAEGQDEKEEFNNSMKELTETIKDI